MPRKWKNRRPVPIKAARRDAPKAFRIAAVASGACAIQAAEGEGKLATFKGVAYTGAQMRPMGWCNDVIIDIAGVQVPSQQRPALRQHDHEQVVGHTTAVTLDGEIAIEGVFSGEKQHVDKVVIPARNGFPWQLSVGADPIRTEFLEAGEETKVNGRTVTGPLTISRETRLGEISFVPLGADGDTSATVAAQKGDTMNPFAIALKALMADLRAAGKVKAAKYSDDEVDAMTADEARAALKKCAAKASDDEEEDEEDDPKESKSARRQRLKAEAEAIFGDMAKKHAQVLAGQQLRVSSITAAAEKYGVTKIEIEADGKTKTVDLVPHALAHDWSADKVELEALRASRPAAGLGVPGGLAYASSRPDVNDAVIEAAVLHACRHQFLLEDDEFYSDLAPDGKAKFRRVPMRLQKHAQDGLKTRYTDQVQQAAHTIFKGRMGLHQLLECGMRGLGYRDSLDLKSEQGMTSMLKAWDFLDRSASIRAEGSSNMSIQNILSNVLNKFALQGYLFTEQSWREIAAIRNVTDFKPSKSINLLGQTMFKQFGPSGELANFSLGDQAFANQAAPYGGILTIPWTHLVNDDMGILASVPLKVGQGAGLALNDWFWSLMASLITGSAVGSIPSGYTLTADDGNAFWRTTTGTNNAANQKSGKVYNPNKISGGSSALSSSSLQTAKKYFDNQVDPNGSPLGMEGMMPILLFGSDNWVTAMELVTYRELVGTGQTSTPKQPNGNIWGGKMKPVMSRYVDNANYVNNTTAFWVLFNPAVLAVIEVAFLQGVDTPEVLQAGPDYQFDRPGISIRGTMPFGANQQNFRGGVYSAGA